MLDLYNSVKRVKGCNLFFLSVAGQLGHGEGGNKLEEGDPDITRTRKNRTAMMPKEFLSETSQGRKSGTQQCPWFMHTISVP